MRSIYYIIAFVIILLFSNTDCAFSQSYNPYKNKKQNEKMYEYNFMEARYCYHHAWYKKATAYYEKVVYHMKDPIVYGELGDCYRALEDYNGAIKNYKESLKIFPANDTVQIKAAKTLMNLGKYDEALTLLQKYQVKHPNDDVSANMMAGCNNAKTIMANPPSGKAVFEDFNTDGSEFAPTFWKGNLVFTSDATTDVYKQKNKWSGSSFYNIYSTTCDTAGHCSSAVAKITTSKKVNIKYHAGPCTFTADGSTMYFTRSNYKKQFLSGIASNPDDSERVHLQIMIATGFDDKTKDFKSIVPFKYNSVKYSVAHPAISPSGNMLVFTSDMPGGQGGSDLYICQKINGDWTMPQNAGKQINTGGEELFPYFADENTLYFSSDGLPGLGGLDIFKTTWNSDLHTFNAPENIGLPVNSSYDDMSLALFADGRSSYFSSNRPGGKAGDNIYYYKRIIDLLALTVTDAGTGNALDNVTATLNNGGTTTNINLADGKSLTPLQFDTHYTLTVSKDGYKPQTVDVMARGDKELDTIKKSIALEAVEKPKPQEPEYVVGRNYKLDKFYFEYNKYDIVEEGKPILDNLALVLEKYKGMTIKIYAYTDCRGSERYNTKLSVERANAVLKYLESKGIDKDRMQCVGMGNKNPEVECPKCNECTEEQHQRNRRMEFLVLSI